MDDQQRHSERIPWTNPSDDNFAKELPKISNTRGYDFAMKLPKVFQKKYGKKL